MHNNLGWEGNGVVLAVVADLHTLQLKVKHYQCRAYLADISGNCTIYIWSANQYR